MPTRISVSEFDAQRFTMLGGIVKVLECESGEDEDKAIQRLARADSPSSATHYLVNQVSFNVYINYLGEKPRAQSSPSRTPRDRWIEQEEAQEARL
jgi:hypothetical protein